MPEPQPYCGSLGSPRQLAPTGVEGDRGDLRELRVPADGSDHHIAEHSTEYDQVCIGDVCPPEDHDPETSE